MLTNVGILWTFWLHRAYFLEENKQAWRMKVDEGKMFFCTMFTQNEYSQMYYSALFCMTINRLG